MPWTVIPAHVETPLQAITVSEPIIDAIESGKRTCSLAKRSRRLRK